MKLICPKCKNRDRFLVQVKCCAEIDNEGIILHLYGENDYITSGYVDGMFVTVECKKCATRMVVQFGEVKKGKKI